MHTNEIVHQLMHWWDDVVFEKFPDWWECINSDDQAVNFNRLDLEAYFGQQDENGPGHYTQGVKYGIGHEVITKMLAGTEKQSDIKEALTALEPTARRKRGLELKAAWDIENLIRMQELIISMMMLTSNQREHPLLNELIQFLKMVLMVVHTHFDCMLKVMEFHFVEYHYRNQLSKRLEQQKQRFLSAPILQFV